jgi:hypothetical protein
MWTIWLCLPIRKVSGVLMSVRCKNIVLKKQIFFMRLSLLF